MSAFSSGLVWINRTELSSGAKSGFKEMETWKLEPAHDLGLSPQARFKSVRRESGLIETGLHVAWWSLVRLYLAGWHRLEIRGREHLPSKPPFVLVANHASHLDALVLAAPFPWRLRDRIFPIAAGDTFFENATTAAFAATMLNALPLWRKHCGPHAMQELRERLVEEPCAYILFPEGTRSRDGVMTHFKPGLGMLVAQTSVPVVPCHLQGAFQALPAHRRWPRFRQIILRVGEPMIFSSVPNDRTGWKAIADSLETKVRELAGEKDLPASA
jgi:1-acyl-sn-glycerol-3-phosphate acyltransferase